MKYLKQLAFACLLASLSISAFAQTSPFRFGVRAGLNLSSAFVNEVDKRKTEPGYHVGVTVDYQLPSNFMIQSGLLFTAKGSELDNLNADSYVGGRPEYTHIYDQLYLEIPIFAAFAINLGNNLDLVGGIGPYFAFGVGGKTKQRSNSGEWSEGVTEREWDTFGNGVFDDNRDWLRGESLRRFDFGAGVKIDLEYYKKYTVGVGFSAGILDIMRKTQYPDLKYRNYNFSVSTGYKF